MLLLKQYCLNLNEKKDPFIHFDGNYDLPEQPLIKKDCAALIGFHLF